MTEPTQPLRARGHRGRRSRQCSRRSAYRGGIAGVVALGIAIALVTCRSDAKSATDTVGVVPEETTTTLLEFVPDTDAPDPTAEPTVPPQFLFGGDPCRALTAEDFTLVSGGLGRGRLIDASPLSDDACGYRVIIVGQEIQHHCASDRWQHVRPTARGRRSADPAHQCRAGRVHR